MRISLSLIHLDAIVLQARTHWFRYKKTPNNSLAAVFFVSAALCRD